MKRQLMTKVCTTALATVVLASLLAAESLGQSSSLFGNPRRRPVLTLGESSWSYRPPAEPKVIQLHDIVTVIVSEQSVVISEGEIDRKKKAHAELTLKDWVMLKGLSLLPDPQSAGDPKIGGKLDNKMRSEAGLETRDSMKFTIACTVEDIRPNGNLIIEAHRTIKNNSETWEYSLSGEIRPDDVMPNNTVQSENIAGMRLNKRETGHVRDAYKRGWLMEILDKYQPF